jgi:hypothetical protein
MKGRVRRHAIDLANTLNSSRIRPMPSQQTVSPRRQPPDENHKSITAAFIGGAVIFLDGPVSSFAVQPTLPPSPPIGPLHPLPLAGPSHERSLSSVATRENGAPWRREEAVGNGGVIRDATRIMSPWCDPGQLWFPGASSQGSLTLVKESKRLHHRLEWMKTYRCSFRRLDSHLSFNWRTD